MPDGRIIMTISIKYKYDKNGNWIVEEYVNEHNMSKFLTEREIEYRQRKKFICSIQYLI